MIKIYYKIWVDCIVKIRSQPNNKDSWWWQSFVLMTMAMILNIYVSLLLLVATEVITKIPIAIKIDVFSGTKLDSLLTFLLQFFLPIGLLNYFLIFYKKKYKKLIEKYEYKNGRLFLTYFIFSTCILVLLIILGYSLFFLGFI